MTRFDYAETSLVAENLQGTVKTCPVRTSTCRNFARDRGHKKWYETGQVGAVPDLMKKG